MDSELKDLQWTVLLKTFRCDLTLKQTCLMRGHLGCGTVRAAMHQGRRVRCLLMDYSLSLATMASALAEHIQEKVLRHWCKQLWSHLHM